MPERLTWKQTVLKYLRHRRLWNNKRYIKLRYDKEYTVFAKYSMKTIDADNRCSLCCGNK